MPAVTGPPSSPAPPHASLRIGVTGATGQLGTRVLQHLATGRKGGTLVALARDPRRLDLPDLPDLVSSALADYDDRASLQRAFTGLTTLVFISSDGDAETMRRHHHNVVDAATTCGVEHVVYTSIIDTGQDSPFYYAPVHRETEHLLRSTSMHITVARTSVFTEFLIDSFVTPALPHGVLELPAGTGRTSLISRDDVAASLATAARSRKLDTAHLTGPHAISMYDVIDAAAIASNQALSYHPIAASFFRRRLAVRHAAAWLIEAFTSMFESIAQQRFATVTDDVMRLTGRPPKSIADVLAARARS